MELKKIKREDDVFVKDQNELMQILNHYVRYINIHYKEANEYCIEIKICGKNLNGKKIVAEELYLLHHFNKKL